MTKPMDVRADYGAVEGLVGRLGTLQMKGITEQELDRCQDLRARRAAVHGDPERGQRAQHAARRDAATGDGSLFAKDASRPMVFTAGRHDGRRPEEGGRRLSAEGPLRVPQFHGHRFEATRDGATVVFEKQKGVDDNAPEKWVQSQPKKDVDETKLLDALSAVTNLRAASFVDAVPADAAPVAQFKAVSGDGKKDDLVTLSQAGRTTTPRAREIQARRSSPPKT